MNVLVRNAWHSHAIDVWNMLKMNAMGDHYDLI